MKETNLKKVGKLTDVLKNHSLGIMVARVICFIFAMTISRCHILGSYYPFGLSLTASTPENMFGAVLAGSIFGYFMPLRLGTGIRYIASIVSIAAMRWAFIDSVKIKNHILYGPAIVFLSSIVTGLAVNCADGISFYSVTITLFECLISAISVYFLDSTIKLMRRKFFYGLSLKDLVCLSMSAGIVLISLSEISVHSISLGKIFAVLLTLTFAYCFGISGGSISGISLGAIFSLSAFGLSYASGSLAFAGMISGVVSSFGRLACCGMFTVSYAVLSFRLGEPVKIVGSIYELIFGVILFSLLPSKFLENLKKFIIKSKSESGSEKSCKIQALCSRLNDVSECFSSAAVCADKVDLEFGNISNINLEEACFDSVKSYCCSCQSRKICWDKNCKSTYEMMRKAINRASESENLKSNLEILRNCRNSESVLRRIYSVKKDFSCGEMLKSQTKEFKNITQRYFGDISCLVSNMDKEFQYEDEIIDVAFSSKLEDIFSGNKIDARNVICRNISNKIFVRFEIGIFDKGKIGKRIIDDVALLTGREFEEPLFQISQRGYIVRLIEKRNYKMNFSVSQHACDGGRFCGDSCRCFEDLQGRFNAVLSDGMGTGSSAAAEGTMVAELSKQFLKFGISSPCALKFINSVMLLNSKTEALTTLDVLSVDLFSGEARLMKAGSPATFIINGKKVKKVGFSSLPVGILSNVSPSFEKIVLTPEDTVIMLSDGVTDIGEKWVIDLLKNLKVENLTEASRYIVSQAVKERSVARDDDITAIALRLSVV